MKSDKVLVRVEHLSKYFKISRGKIFRRNIGAIQALDDISFSIYEGETLGMVGESGCGKTTAGRTILQLYRPTSGKVEFQGMDLGSLNATELRHTRKYMQMIFQDPYASLNPRMTVGSLIAEPLNVHNIGDKKDRQERVCELLSLVGLNHHFVSRYPHEFSGGQRQRVGIARALALHPKFIVCDEPISSLDVSIQAQVVNLLEELQDKLGLTYLFIAHDLSMVRHISDRTAVMYLGKLMELAGRDELYEHPCHPYTQSLLSAVPIPNPKKERKRERIILKGDVPSPAKPPSGCRFHTRCALVEKACSKQVPEWHEISPDHWVACHLGMV